MHKIVWQVIFYTENKNISPSNTRLRTCVRIVIAVCHPELMHPPAIPWQIVVTNAQSFRQVTYQNIALQRNNNMLLRKAITSKHGNMELEIDA